MAHGTRIDGVPDQHELDNQLAVCVMDNRMFKAVAICYSQDELEAFKYPDGCPKTWWVPKDLKDNFG